MSVAIIDYGSGNLRSAAKAFERMAREAELNIPISVTPDPEIVARADRIVLPGVGAFADCMNGLSSLDGMVDVLEQAVLREARPFLGICVGMQLLATVGREHGDHQGLGWVEGEVVALTPSDPSLKIPHMGWNQLSPLSGEHPVLASVASGDHAYFVHSYRFAPAEQADILATTDYGGPIAAIIGRHNIVGTQFHPEKSQETGLRLIRNFLEWTP
ncbi:MAG: imidazole glycerol phosphate synthase subunit HisH [Pseudomonadota bacterium]